MKNARIFILICLVPAFALAQNLPEGSETPTIVDKINKPAPGKGSVRIIQSNEIAERLGRPGKKSESVGSSYGNGKYAELSGFRIQVFAGNNQRISKNEAYRKEASIKSVFPEVSTYVSFNSPFWRLKVGDFQSFQDAQKFLNRLRSQFPEFGKEMSVVRDKVRIKVN